jgi:hypothetical protein
MCHGELLVVADGTLPVRLGWRVDIRDVVAHRG